MNKLLFVIDLGHFFAYRLSKTPQGTGRLDMLESFESGEAHNKYSNKVTDQAGKFGESVGKNSSIQGTGESHNIDLENEKRLLKTISKAITRILKEEKNDGWFMAAEKAINKQIVDCLDQDVKSKLEKNIAADLTKADKADIVARFV
jgi:hypothetical protein